MFPFFSYTYTPVVDTYCSKITINPVLGQWCVNKNKTSGLDINNWQQHFIKVSGIILYTNIAHNYTHIYKKFVSMYFTD